MHDHSNGYDEQKSVNTHSPKGIINKTLISLDFSNIIMSVNEIVLSFLLKESRAQMVDIFRFISRST